MPQHNRIVVCEADELKPGNSRIVKVNKFEIAVLNVSGKLYAVQNYCPHMGAPLICGHVAGTMLPSEPHEYEYGLHNEIIRCPLHGWEFSLETGRTLFDPKRVKLKTFEVVQEENSIVLYTKLGANQNAEVNS